ncbi:hypothetical protein ZIOFF_043164 [Zingiber officinale]|uniref:Protein NEGATIVE REGULATOR OF RESISTANCE n=1 Tax=Zingiber officinale TaxID=94328 RepID=A0A8J5FWU4_ZINOF|nr:hypothetical protein ZIOFF_043164 [Zingiber officinale]
MLTSLTHFHKQEGRMDASSSQRKRSGGGDDRLPSKPRPACSSLPRGEKGPAASEEDVEEFFAILRRMHDASQSVSVGRGTAASARWSSSFACEGGDGARAVMPAVDEEAKRPQGIDLNADPGPEAEGVAVPSPLGEYAALSVPAYADHDLPHGAGQRLGVLSVHDIAVRGVANRGVAEGSRDDRMSDGECS